MRELRGHVVLSVLLAAAVPVAAQDSPAAAKPECGFYCLAVALRTAGVGGADAKSLRAALGDPGTRGYSLADLDRVARELGAETLAVSTSLDGLKARVAAGDRYAAITHVDGNHFVLVSGFAPDGRVEVIDAPRTYEQPPETFAARWDGAALLVARDPLTPEADLPGPFPWLVAALSAGGVLCAAGVIVLWWRGRDGAAPRRSTRPVSAAGAAFLAATLGLTGCDGDGVSEVVGAAADGPPRAVFERVRHDAGEVPVSADGHVFAFPVTNRGGRPLRFTGPTASCGCTDADVTADVLGRGESAAVGPPGDVGRRPLSVPVSAFVLDPGDAAVAAAGP